ncbi:hypothetical protein T12_12741 [Trichinella patagoniensis]|uniref:Uncharacterized protein n=1 Tax=Trichinella patagoniensis TaxID=990121 RepID=A0A0V1A690_9BILA|nr:hypothetical protein T12_12741 [Trichinella patagoniensis]
MPSAEQQQFIKLSVSKTSGRLHYGWFGLLKCCLGVYESRTLISSSSSSVILPRLLFAFEESDLSD